MRRKLSLLCLGLGVLSLTLTGAGCGDDSGGGGGAVCGNGLLEAGEECDDGNTMSGDGCSAACLIEGTAECGNGIVEGGEECDDGNLIEGDGCSSFCVLEVEPGCGNGVLEAGEECDDGNSADGDGCSSTCMLEGTAECGNGVLEGNEECDDGNTDDGDGCSANCTIEGTEECGNGVLEGNEECDDGNTDNTDGCLDTCVSATCGDGYLWDGNEECDDGNTDDGDGCSANCTIEGTEECGNGVLEGNEECDDGNTDNTDGCLDTCVSATCGDGYLWDGNEECDDGNTDNTDGCLDTCVSATCGDGFLWAGNEECDDGNTDDGDGCSSNCTIESTATCGNGTVEAGETCDDGNNDNTDACPDGTGGTCQTATCGDGFLWAGNEECDDGNNDDGDGCSSNCTIESTATCGNGTVEAGETCDDGNGINTDACPDGTGGTCQTAICGDGFLWAGTEECDDGNNDDGDGCSSNCTIESTATCGNGTVEAGETCDDGNGINTDDCPDGVGGTCQPAECGDGFVYTGVEECDDGNNDDGDGCSSICEVEGTPECVPDWDLTCGATDVYNNGNAGNTDNTDNYSCVGWDESGPEYTYNFVPSYTGPVTISLSNMSADMDLFVLDGSGGVCSGSACLTYGDVSVTFDVVAGTPYFIVVDGYAGAVGDYQIDVACGDCGNGVVEGSEECDDGNNDDGDGCSSTCQNEVNCTAADTIACGETDSYDTTQAGATNDVDSYSCVGWDESGPEYVYEFVANNSEEVTMTLSGLSVDLDLFVLEDLGNGCLAQDCLAYGDISATFNAVAGTTYYIVVDGYEGAAGAYTLDVACNTVQPPQPDGAPCTDNTDCISGSCLDEATMGFPGGMCAQDCTSQPCASPDTVCTASGGGTSYCIAACSVQNDCRAGYGCWDLPDGDVCVPDCDDDAQCDNNSCNEWTGYCMDDANLARDGEPCTQDADCESNYCLDAFPNGYCTSYCTLALDNCPGDGACADMTASNNVGLCMDGCSQNSDCRETDGYSCNSMPEAGGALVCMP